MSATVQNLEFDWDKAANLKVRRDLQANKREEFDYDGLYRLTQSRLYATVAGGTASQTDNNTYDAIGNLTNKGGAAGAHTYSGYNYGTRTGCSDTVVRPHAVYQVNAAGTTRRYCYDGNGNLATVSRTSGTGPILYDATSWWVANLAKRISQGGTAAYSDFWYGPGRERIQQEAKKNASVTETTLYVGGAYEKVTRGATVEHVHYIRGGGDVVAIRKQIAGGTTETRYLHRDHLGSVVAASDYLGNVLERYSFDPWGKRRDPASWLTPAPGTFAYDPAFNDRGYTGHEHIDHLGLVNMNGRVYDPEIGRFLSADPFVQFPESTQGYNRYTYVGNNPLSYTDPSGFFSFRQVLQVVGLILSFWLPGAGAWVQHALLDAILKGFVAGFLAGGGDLRAGMLGALGGGLFFKVGNLGLGDIAHAFVKGIVGGGLSALGGGKFKEGFLGAFAGGFLGEKLKFIGGETGSGGIKELIKRVVRDAVVGGVASELGGGKFKNGAITAAFARMFNDEREHLSDEEKESRLEAEIKIKIGKVIQIEKGTSSEISAALRQGDVLKLEVESDGTYVVGTDRVSIGGNLDSETVFTGFRASALSVSFVVQPDGDIQFVGTLSIPRELKILGVTFSASFISKPISVQSAILNSNGLLGAAARQPWERRKRIDRCSVEFECGD